MGLFSRNKQQDVLQKGIARTKESFLAKLTRTIIGHSTVDDEVLDRLEETLITSDVGVETSLKIIEKLQERIKRDKYISTSELHSILRAEIAQLLRQQSNGLSTGFDAPLNAHPYVILVVGVNGVARPPPSPSWPTNTNRRAKK